MQTHRAHVLVALFFCMTTMMGSARAEKLNLICAKGGGYGPPFTIDTIQKTVESSLAVMNFRDGAHTTGALTGAPVTQFVRIRNNSIEMGDLNANGELAILELSYYLDRRTGILGYRIGNGLMFREYRCEKISGRTKKF